MFFKLSTALTIFAIAAQVVVASPPACLIDAVNTQDNPHDIKGVCNAAKEVAKAMSANCGDAMDTATEWFASVCKDAGVTISTSNSDSSSTKSASKSSSTASSDSSSSASSETTGTMTSAESPTASASTATGSDAPTSTGAASRVGLDFAGMVAVGIFGAMIAL